MWEAGNYQYHASLTMGSCYSDCLTAATCLYMPFALIFLVGAYWLQTTTTSLTSVFYFWVTCRTDFCLHTEVISIRLWSINRVWSVFVLLVFRIWYNESLLWDKERKSETLWGATLYTCLSHKICLIILHKRGKKNRPSLPKQCLCVSGWFVISKPQKIFIQLFRLFRYSVSTSFLQAQLINTHESRVEWLEKSN